MSGQYKYRRNASACKIAEESACTTGDSACKLIFLYFKYCLLHFWQASGHVLLMWTQRSCMFSCHVFLQLSLSSNHLTSILQDNSSWQTDMRAHQSSAKKHGQRSSKNRKRDSSCTYTGHSPSHYWECRGNRLNLNALSLHLAGLNFNPLGNSS